MASASRPFSLPTYFHAKESRCPDDRAAIGTAPPTAESGSDFRIRAEVFRDGTMDAAGQFLDVARRERGTIGPDVLTESVSNPQFNRIFDLRTNGRVQYPISSSRQEQFQNWFRGHAEEIFRTR